MKRDILSTTHHFLEIMLNIITRTLILCFAAHRTRERFIGDPSTASGRRVPGIAVTIEGF